MELHSVVTPVVHSYDIERHAIRCGLPGHTSSSKHRSSVNCPACLRLLAVASDAEASGASGGATR